MKKADRNYLIYELKTHFFKDNLDANGSWTRYENNIVVKINRKTGKINFIDSGIDQERANYYWTTDEYTGDKTKHAQTFTARVEFTINKPIGRDSGDWIMFYSDNPSLNAGMTQVNDNDGEVTRTELAAIHHEGSVIQVYLE